MEIQNINDWGHQLNSQTRLKPSKSSSSSTSSSSYITQRSSRDTLSSGYPPSNNSPNQDDQLASAHIKEAMDSGFTYAINGDWPQLLVSLRQQRDLINQIDDSGMTILHWACLHHDVPNDIILKLLFANPKTVTIRNTAGHLPIDLALQACCGNDVLDVLRAADDPIGSDDPIADRKYQDHTSDSRSVTSSTSYTNGDTRSVTSSIGYTNAYNSNYRGSQSRKSSLSIDPNNRRRTKTQLSSTPKIRAGLESPRPSFVGSVTSSYTSENRANESFSGQIPTYRPSTATYFGQDKPRYSILETASLYSNPSSNVDKKRYYSHDGTSTPRKSSVHDPKKNNNLHPLQSPRNRRTPHTYGSLPTRLRDLDESSSVSSITSENTMMNHGSGCYKKSDSNFGTIDENQVKGEQLPPKSNRAKVTVAFPPRWKEGPTCHVCIKDFGVMRRRHHCRNCGESVCRQHSLYRLPLPKYGLAAPQRICDLCFLHGRHLPNGDNQSPQDIDERSHPIRTQFANIY